MRGVRIVLTIEPDEATWGFLQAIEGYDNEAQKIAAVVELAHEDLGALLEEAQWKVEFV